MKTMLKAFFKFISNCIKSVPDMDQTHLLLSIAVFLFMAILFVLAFLGSRKKIIRPVPALFAILFLGLSLFLFVLASNMGTVVFEPVTTPESTADAFLSACIQNDEASASTYITTGEPVFSFAENPDDVTLLYEKALKESYSYTIGTNVRTEGTTAYVPVEFTSLNLSDMIPDLLSATNSKLEKTVEENRKSEVFDEDGNYKTEIIESIYKDAVTQTLRKKDSFIKKTSLTLCLEYASGEWKVQPNDNLKTALSGGFFSASNGIYNLKSEVLGDITFIPKIYTIDENATAGPKPDPNKYGFTQDVNEILALVEKNPALTKGKDCYFNPEGTFICDGFRYYSDETILCYTWREKIDNHACTFAEIYIADPSQFRRKLSGDNYGSTIQKYGSELSKDANAVVAMNSDFYKFRAEGMMVYMRTLYRFNPHKLELCHVNSKGEMCFTYAEELATEEDAKRYVEENDILFTLAFGPVLVANGEPHTFSNYYLLGQVNETYSRSVLAQEDGTHFLLMTLNHGYGCPTATAEQTQNVILSKGVVNAYMLDGGQTGEIIMQHKVLNHIDFDTERTVSDILYFTTALPEEENQ